MADNGDEYTGDLLMEEEYHAWYQNQATPPPFKLSRKINLKNPVDLQTVSPYPWNEESLNTLWGGGLNTIENVHAWKEIISEFWDAVAVGSDSSVHIFFAHQNRAPVSIKIPVRTPAPENKPIEVLQADKTCVAWAMPKSILEPLLIISRGSIVYIYNVIRVGISGCLRGHGDTITSISVHPSIPNLFCTTSRDFTTRIYDLALPAQYTIDEIDMTTQRRMRKNKGNFAPNPHWPPGKEPSLAGAAHGLRLPLNEWEGKGDGRCIIVLQGGRSGGHQAAVLCSAFHPTLPLIATGGLDRVVKIWPVRTAKNYTYLKREDKPLFSSGRVHKARVHSISWLQDDLLLTHSAPAIMRKFPHDKEKKDWYTEPGELIVWRWLGLDRFFPPAWESNTTESLKNLRGCSSDYQESASFKVISIHSFKGGPNLSQLYAPNLNLYQSPTHDPLAVYVYPGENSVCLFNIAHMVPREKPPFPPELQRLLDAEKNKQNDTKLSNAIRAVNLNPQAAGQSRTRTDEEQLEDNLGRGVESRDHDEEEGEADPMKMFIRPKVPVPDINCRQLVVEVPDDVSLVSSAMGADGRLIIGVGKKGMLWVWKKTDE